MAYSFEFVTEFDDDFVDGGADHSTGTTPWRPKINKDRDITVQYFLFPIGVSDLLRLES